MLLTLPSPQLAGVRIRLLFWILLKFKQALAVLNMQGMEGAQVLILHDADVKGYRKKPLSQLQFLYWGAHSKVAPEAQIPFVM